MTIYYWTNFVKRKNSTLQPLIALATMVTDVHLKEGTSIEKPVFQLTGNLFTANYVRAFDHFYFVDDITSVRNNLVEISCSMDVLATFKVDIADYTALIERSASFYNTKYPDPLVALKNDTQVTEVEVGTSAFFSNAGCFVVSVINNIGSGTGFTTSYVMDQTGLTSLAAYLNTDIDSLAAQDVLQWLQATFLRTANSVIDCIYMPLLKSVVTGASSQLEQVVIGVDQVPQCWAQRMLTPYVASKYFDVSIPHFYSDFRKASPYTIGKIYIPGFGVADFNPIDFSTDTIRVAFLVDVMTGDTICFLTDPGPNLNDRVVASYSYNIAVSCPVARVGSNVTGTATGILSTAASIAAARVPGNKFAAVSGLSAAATGVNTLATALGTTSSVSGSKSGRAGIEENDIHVTVIAHNTQDPDNLLSESGRVCMETKKLSLCSGYVKCVNADVPIAGMSTEKDEVNNFLNNGFYYE